MQRDEAADPRSGGTLPRMSEPTSAATPPDDRPALTGEPPAHRPTVPLTDALDDLDRLIAATEGRSVSLHEVESALRGRGVAMMLLILSIPFIIPVAIPLLATVCGIPMIAIGLRIAILNNGDLPAFARRRELSADAMRAIARGLRTVLRPIAFLFHPRLGIMFWPASWRLTGVSICMAAFVLSLPIPVPFANMIPAIGLIHFAAGLIQRDGIAICVGHFFTLASYAYLWLIWDVAVKAIAAIFS